MIRLFPGFCLLGLGLSLDITTTCAITAGTTCGAQSTPQ